MNPEIFKNGFEKAYQSYGNVLPPRSLLKLKRGLYKKLWQSSLIDDSYYFIVDHPTMSLSFVSREVEAVMGYLPSEFDISFLKSKIHPDDRCWYLATGKDILDFFSKLTPGKLMKYKVCYDLRYRKKNGQYTRLLYQGIVLELDGKGRLLKTLGVHTDIFYLKQEGKSVLSFIGMEGEPSFIDVGSKNIWHERPDDLTERERQVVNLLMNGKSSKEIGSILKISKQTVDTHRKNMLRKKNLSTTGELVGKAIKMGWV